MQHIYIGSIIGKRTNHTRHLILFIRFASTLKCSCFPGEWSCSLSSSCWSNQALEAAWARAAGKAPAVSLQDVPLPCGQWQQPLPKHVTPNALPGLFPSRRNPAFPQATSGDCSTFLLPYQSSLLPGSPGSVPYPTASEGQLWPLPSSTLKSTCRMVSLGQCLVQEEVLPYHRQHLVGVTLEASWKCQPRRTAILWSERNDAANSSGTPSPPSPSQFMQAIFITLPVGDKSFVCYHSVFYKDNNNDDDDLWRISCCWELIPAMKLNVWCPYSEQWKVNGSVPQCMDLVLMTQSC